MSLQDFVNREHEIETFQELLSQRRRPILLLQGTRGMGKTTLTQRLRALCNEIPILSVVVDFHNRPPDLNGNLITQRLRESIGGRFSEQLGQIELDLEREFRYTVIRNQNDAREAIAAAQGFGASSSPGVSLSGDIQITGDVIGRDQITIINTPLASLPGFGSQRLQAEIKIRRNRAFREALTELAVDQQVVLFFDHVEEATTDELHWLQEHVMNIHRADAHAFRNLLVVIADITNRWQADWSYWHDILEVCDVGPLSHDAIYTFWVNRRGLDPVYIDFILQVSRGDPSLLYLMADNLELSLKVSTVHG